MSIHVALYHQTRYTYEREVNHGPHLIRLRPAPHCRTKILSYSQAVTGGKHFINWQQDPFSNWNARLVFLEPMRELSIEVELVVEMSVYNPFDFFVEEAATDYPFAYEPGLKKELAPFLEAGPATPQLDACVASLKHAPGKIRTIDFLVALNRRIQSDIAYLIRHEAGVQTPEETLTKRSGSCRDSGWLLVQLLRHFGLAARFVSGYLVQLTPGRIEASFRVFSPTKSATATWSVSPGFSAKNARCSRIWRRPDATTQPSCFSHRARTMRPTLNTRILPGTWDCHSSKAPI